MDIYYIGGSPCSGKSTVAKQLKTRFGLSYYKLDNYLDDYMNRLAKGGNELCVRVSALEKAGMWMRDPAEMCAEEQQIYRDMFPLVRKQLERYPANKAVVAEGAGLMPELMERLGVPQNRYICMVPTRRFQQEKYAQRSWINYYLRDSGDPKKAFSNWMERDALFAEAVQEDALWLGYQVLVTDGYTDEEQTFAAVCSAFGLSPAN